MKNLFPEYNKKSDDEYRAIWDNCILCLDTSFILDLYRISETSREEFFSLLERLKDKIWIPYQVALEYNRNKDGVVIGQIKSLIKTDEEVEKSKAALLTQLEKDYKRYALRNDIKPIIEDAFKNIHDKIEELKKPYQELKKDDAIFDRLCKLFEGKISTAYTDQELKEIYEEGAIRFAKETPPGYKDSAKEDEKEKDPDLENRRIYGDLIIWKDMIKKAEADGKPLILATGEEKVDWIRWVKGEKKGARPELIREMKDIAKQDFLLYTTERFYEYGKTFFNEVANKETIEEIKSARIRDLLFTKEEIEKAEKTTISFGELYKHTQQRDLSEQYLKTTEELRRQMDRKILLQKFAYQCLDKGKKAFYQSGLEDAKQDILKLNKRLEYILEQKAKLDTEIVDLWPDPILPNSDREVGNVGSGGYSINREPEE